MDHPRVIEAVRLHAPRQREDGEHDGAKEGAWRGSSASAVDSTAYWRTPVLCISGPFVAALEKWFIQRGEVTYVRYMNVDSKKKQSCSFVDWSERGKSRAFVDRSERGKLLSVSSLPSHFSIPTFICHRGLAPSPLSPHSRQQRRRPINPLLIYSLPHNDYSTPLPPTSKPTKREKDWF